MKWILIVLTSYTTSPSVSPPIEFNSQEACENAKETVFHAFDEYYADWIKRGYNNSWTEDRKFLCLPKGLITK